MRNPAIFKRFGRNCDGNVATIFAIAAIPLIGATGAVIDFGKAFEQSAVTQGALDSAALAANKLIGILPEKEIKKAAKNFFYANTDGKLLSRPELDVGISKGTVEVKAELVQGTIFMGIFGIDQITMNLRAVSVAGNAKYEVVMVLDNSGSMKGSKISALREAAEDLSTALFEVSRSNPNPDPVKIGLVPFAASVNVGSQYANAAWMDRTGLSPIHYEELEDDSMTRWDLFDTMEKVSWEGCVTSRPGPHDVDDSAPTTSMPSTLFVPMFAPDEADLGPYTNSYIHDDKGSCPKDTPKTGISIASQQEAQARLCKYQGEKPKGTTSVDEPPKNDQGGPNWNCTSNPVQPLTSSESIINKEIGQMKASGMTNIHAGVMWGWRLLSPTEPFTEGRPYDAEDNHKIMIVMTDGENTYSTYPNFNKSMYGAFGYVAKNHLDTTSVNNWQVIEKMNVKTLAACNNAKGGGRIAIYTVAFQVKDFDTLSLLENCASSPEMAFRSESNGDLITTFQKIATQISLLRLEQ